MVYRRNGLGIPVDFTNEGIHGLTHDRATPFPAPINIGSTWDKDTVGKIGNTIGKEAYYLGYTNVYAPILDVSRDRDGAGLWRLMEKIRL